MTHECTRSAKRWAQCVRAVTHIHHFGHRARGAVFQPRVVLDQQRDTRACTTRVTCRQLALTKAALRCRARGGNDACAPSANAEQLPSVLRVTSTCTPMNLDSVPSASLTGAVTDSGSRAALSAEKHAHRHRREVIPMVRKHQNGVPSCASQRVTCLSTPSGDGRAHDAPCGSSAAAQRCAFPA